MTEPDPLMSIGMFSRASLVSIKALRAYHDQGLLIPAEIDPDTGYRSYRVSQLADAQIIKRLRDLDVPLRDVAEVMSARDPRITRKVITEHATEMQRRLDDVTRIVEELQRAVEIPTIHTPVHVRVEPPVDILAVTGSVEDPEGYADFLGAAYAQLWAGLGETGLELAGPSGALYPGEVRGEPEEITAFLPVGLLGGGAPSLPAGLAVERLPSVTAAVMTHVGSYDSCGETYRQLGAWVAQHAESAAEPVRELYVVSVDPATGGLLPDDQLRTEIVWPIAPGSHPTTDHQGET
ncbi:MAG: MerR family transcriptional regulator [Actinomycetota bacterium]